jgi:WD40 repeat protein
MRSSLSRAAQRLLALALFSVASPALAIEGETPKSDTAPNVWITSLTWDSANNQIWGTQAQGLLLRPGQVIRTTLDNPSAITNVYETGASAWAVALIPEANSLLSVDYKGKLLRSDIATPNTTQAIEVPMRWSRVLLPVGDGKVIAGSEDGKLIEIHLPDGAVVAQWDAHTAAIHNIALSPDKTLLASCAGDGTIKIWNRSNNTEVKSLSYGKAAVWELAFTRDNTKLVAADADRRLNLFDVASGKLQMTLQMLPDWGTALSMHPTENVVAVGCMNGSAQFYDLNTFRRVGSWDGVGSGVWDLIFAPDGSKAFVATRKHGIATISADVWSGPLTTARAEAPSEVPPAP